MNPTRRHRFSPQPGRGLRIRLVAMLAVLALTSGCIPGFEPPPSVLVSTASETVGPVNTPEFVGGPVDRRAQITIPAGALEGGVSGRFRLGGSTSTPSPFPAVEFVIGDPISDTVVVDAVGGFVEEFDWELPVDCDNGCEVMVPVTIEQTGEGDPPRFGWSVSFYVEYEGSVPPEAEDMTAVIEPANSE